MNKVIEKGLKAKGYYGYENTETYFNELPDEYYFQNFNLYNLSIIDLNEKKINKIKINADYSDVDENSSSITLFLFDDGKILGHVEYRRYIQKPKEHISGKFFLFKSNLLLFVEWNNYNWLIELCLSNDTIKYFDSVVSKYKIDKPISVIKETKVIQESKKKTTLLPLMTKQKSVSFKPNDNVYTIPKLLLLSEILRFGWEVTLIEQENILQISKDGKSKLVMLHLANQKTPKWNIKYKEEFNKMIHAFINVHKDPYEDYTVYNIKGTTLIGWLKKNLFEKLILSNADKTFSKYENDWDVYS